MEVFHERQPIEDCCMQFYLLWGLHDITEILLKVALNKHHILLYYKGRLSHLLIPFPNFDKFFLENITQKMFLHLWVSCLLCHSDLQHKHTLSRTIQRTFIPSFVPAWARCIRYTIMRQSLSVTCDRSVVFSGHSGFLQQTDCHNITEILLNVSAWNGRLPSRQIRLISYSGDQKLLQIR